jgi:MoxR-like ATPase
LLSASSGGAEKELCVLVTVNSGIIYKKKNNSMNSSSSWSNDHQQQQKQVAPDDDDECVVDEYLHRILAAVTLLAQKPTAATDHAADDEDAVLPDATTTPSTSTVLVRLGTVDPIARQLLIASRPDVLASSTRNLPRLALHLPGVSNHGDNDVMDLHDIDNDDDEEADDEVVLSYKIGRVDHLRQLLRAMAPIQLDVAAHVATILYDSHLHLSSKKSKEPQKDPQHEENWTTNTTMQIQAAAAVILFSVWLPVAPQITPIVSSLLAVKTGLLSCPLSLVAHQQYQHNDQPTKTLLLRMQACHELVDYYYQTQMDHSFILSWNWDWSPVFQWLNDTKLDDDDDDDEHDDNVDMIVNHRHDGISLFNIQQAIRWHAVRTAASLLDLKPVAKAEYVQRHSSSGAGGSSSGIQQELVPWVLHPWARNQQEYVTQRLSFMGRAQIWQKQAQNQNHNDEQRGGNDDDDDDNSFACPTAWQIRNVLPLHPYLVNCGRGLVLVKRNILLRHDDELVPTRRQQKQQEEDGDDDCMDSSNIPNGGDDDHNNDSNGGRRCPLIRTPTTARNLSLLAANLCIQPFPPPILLCGPGGSGKSSLVRELARLLSAKTTATSNSSGYHHDDDLLEIHVDEEMDTKTLVGSYTTTDIPGEFTWRPGALTIAVRLGKWVLIEDLPLVPLEIQASLVQLLKDRLLPLGNGKVEPCHANFRLFATMTTTTTSSSTTAGGTNSHSSISSLAGKRLLHPDLWAHVHVKPLPFVELQEISQGLYRNIPDFIVQTVFGIFKVLDESGRQEQQQDQRQGHHDDCDDSMMSMAHDDETNIMSSSPSSLSLVRRMTIVGGRAPSVRDLFKVLSRISHGVVFEQHQQQQRFALESQRMICLQNVIDIFAAACADDETRREFILTLAAPAFNLTADLAMAHYQTRRPTLVQHESFTEIGRARIHVSPSSNLESSSLSSNGSKSNNSNFAATGSALRIMESIGLCISENEPVLLVGETGGGKTTILQQLARLCGRELIVQNLSLQTDSTDLLGGYRPFEIRHIARLVYQDFVDLFVATFSRKQNADFLTFTATAQAKGQWKKLSQCFRRAAQLGLAKVKDNNDNKPRVAWERFSQSATKFEQQRIACDSGLAFVFTEGALVDAIRKGKWVLLDEINLASSETLQRLCGLLDDATSSITLTERGDAVAIERHADFRLFGAMNPATDSGKKDLSSSVRSRFTELYIDELLDPVELRAVAGRYLSSVLPAVGDCPPDHSETVMTVVDLYLQCRHLADYSLVDGGGHRPRYTLRTLSRALTAARTLVTEQRVGLSRALYEGFELAFQGPLEAKSLQSIKKVIYPALGQGLKSKEMDHPGRRPGNQSQADNYVLIKPFWIRRGPLEPIDWSEESSLQTGGRFSKFVLTPSTAINVRRLARAIASGPWPILLEGATSTGVSWAVQSRVPFKHVVWLTLIVFDYTENYPRRVCCSPLRAQSDPNQQPRAYRCSRVHGRLCC